MEYMYAALLLHSAGRDITEEAIDNILNVAGIQSDETRIKMLVVALDEIDIDEAIKMPLFATPAPPPVAPVEEEKKEEPEPEEEDDGGLGALFR